MAGGDGHGVSKNIARIAKRCPSKLSLVVNMLKLFFTITVTITTVTITTVTITTVTNTHQKTKKINREGTCSFNLLSGASQ